MAVFNITATLDAILSKVSASGHFRAGSQLGEPKSPPDGVGLFAAVFVNDIAVAGIVASGDTIERHDVTIRIYRNMLSEPIGDIEKDLAKGVTDLSNDLAGDYDLNSTVRAIDYGGIHGTPLTTTWGYVDVSGTMFRIADIALGLIVDDSSTLVA